MSTLVAVRDQLYIYGVLDASAALETEALGRGVAGGTVEISGHGSLRALVSTIDPGQVAQTRRNMLAHTAVLERTMAQTTVLPLRFGTVAPDIEALSTCIARNDAAFRTAMQTIDGRIELGVKASWREGVVFAEIIENDANLTRLRNRLRDLPASETYYERVELGRRVETALTARRTTEAAALIAQLSPLAEKMVELKTLDEDMILNRAFLVRRENEAAFDTQMQALAERHDARMTFRYIGPVPPYNFVQLHANWAEA